MSVVVYWKKYRGRNLFLVIQAETPKCPPCLSWNAYEITFVLADAKRLIGRKFDEPTVQSDMKHWPFKVSIHQRRAKLKGHEFLPWIKL